MSTTIPLKFETQPTLTPVKAATIEQWYHSALGDSDKATDMDDAYFYDGLVSGLETTMKLLHEPDETAVIIVKESPSNFKRAVVIVVVVGGAYLLIQNREKIKAKVDEYRKNKGVIKLHPVD